MLKVHLEIEMCRGKKERFENFGNLLQKMKKHDEVVRKQLAFACYFNVFTFKVMERQS